MIVESTAAPASPAACGQVAPPPAFVPATADLDLASADGREAAAEISSRRIRESFQTTLAVQADPALSNARHGFFLSYVNSWNEWHEGHAFEPMADAPALNPSERAVGYFNPLRGDYRLAVLRELLQGVLSKA